MATKTKSLGRRRRFRDTIVAYIFLAPAMIIFIVFVLYPLVSTLFYLSFHRYNILDPPMFVGLRNFRNLINHPASGRIFMNTFRLGAVLLPLHVIMGLFLAYLVYRERSGKLQYIYRTAIYIPAMLTTAAVAVAWRYFYSTEFGVFNWFLSLVGIDPVPWLTSSSWTIPSIAIFSFWKFIGITFLYYFIGFQNIPTSYHEAAIIDGANNRQVFFKIYLPLLSPTTFFVVTVTLIGVLQIFDEPFIITHGGPGDSSRTVALFIYERAFEAFDMGFASAIAFVLFIIIMILTVLQFTLQRRWVNYDSE